MNSKFCTILLVLSSLWTCNTQEGFTEGAFLRLHNGTTEDIIIVFSNANGLADSAECSMSEMIQVPIDMYSPSMTFNVKGSDRTSELSVAYSTSVRKTVLGIKLNLENITALLDTAANDHVFMRGETFDQEMAFKNTDYPLDSASSWSFINDVSGVLWIE
jgi:hypothetical protein